MSDPNKLRSPTEHVGWHSRGYLPHLDAGEIPQFITFGLADAIPAHVMERWRRELTHAEGSREARLRRRVERYLDMGYGSAVLRDPSVGGIVRDALLYLDGKRYGLTAWVVMPNHVHMQAVPFEGCTLPRIMHSLKSFTSHRMNEHLGRSGTLWQEDYFDRYIRDERHYLAVIDYIEENPVKAGLCRTRWDWPLSSAAFRQRP